MTGARGTRYCPGGRLRSGGSSMAPTVLIAPPTVPSSPPPADPASRAPQHLRDRERHLERLLVVEPRVDERLVAPAERPLVDLLSPAEHLGDVVAGELDVEPARHGPGGLVRLEEAPDLVQDGVEAAGLVPVGRGEGVAVHGVAHPGHRAALGADR